MIIIILYVIIIIMEKNYIVKSVVPKVWDWKVVGYSINYHHKNYPDSVQSVFVWVNEMKNLYSVENEQQAQSLVGQSCSIDKKLIIK